MNFYRVYLVYQPCGGRARKQYCGVYFGITPSQAKGRAAMEWASDYWVALKAQLAAVPIDSPAEQLTMLKVFLEGGREWIFSGVYGWLEARARRDAALLLPNYKSSVLEDVV